jgi:hypothetical protein
MVNRLSVNVSDPRMIWSRKPRNIAIYITFERTQMPTSGRGISAAC